MRSLLPLAAAGGAGVLWHSLPRWVKVPAVVGLVALAALELNKDFNESWFSSATFAGAGAEGESKAVDPLKTEADAAAGKPVSGAARMMANQVQSTGADAIQKEAVAAAASETEQELLAKQAKGAKLTAMESLRIFELKKLRSEAKSAEAASTAARASALAEKQSAEIASRVIRSMNDGTIVDTLIDLSGVRAVVPDVPRFDGKRR